MNETASDPSSNPEIANKFETGKAHAKQAAEDLRSAAEQKATELRSAAEGKAQELRSKAEQVYEDARNRARTFQEEGEAYVRDNPMRGVMTALGVGFVLGLLFRR